MESEIAWIREKGGPQEAFLESQSETDEGYGMMKALSYIHFFQEYGDVVVSMPSRPTLIVEVDGIGYGVDCIGVGRDHEYRLRRYNRRPHARDDTIDEWFSSPNNCVQTAKGAFWLLRELIRHDPANEVEV